MQLSDIYDVLLLRAGFNSVVVIIGATLLGVAAGIVGAFALLRKRAMMSDALAHSTLPGLVLAFFAAALWGFEAKNFYILLCGAILSGGAGVLVVQAISRYTRLTEDTAIGIVLSVFFGAGVVLLSAAQNMHSAGAAGLNNFIYGQTAAMRSVDAYFIFIIALVVIFAAFIFLKEFSLVSFDSEFALVQGWKTSHIDLIMMSLVTVVTVLGLQVVGIILIVALLIIPAAAARFWTERLSSMILISALIGGLSGYLGSAASSLLPRLPAGAVIVLAAGIIFIVSFLFAPRRGVLVGTYRLLYLRLKVFTDHVLRDLYESLERDEVDLRSQISIRRVPILRNMQKIHLKSILQVLQFQGFISCRNGSVSLTERGLQEARRLIRNHRLWEQYIFEYAGVAPTHVDYSADFAEHALSAEIIDKLESSLEPLEKV